MWKNTGCKSRFTSKSLQAKLVEIIPFFIKSSSNSGCLYARWTRSDAILQIKKRFFQGLLERTSSMRRGGDANFSFVNGRCHF